MFSRCTLICGIVSSQFMLYDFWWQTHTQTHTNVHININFHPSSFSFARSSIERMLFMPIHINVCLWHCYSTFNWALSESKWINADDLISVLSLSIVSLWNLRYHGKSVRASACLCVIYFVKRKTEKRKERQDEANGEKEWQLNQNGIFNSSMAMLSLFSQVNRLRICLKCETMSTAHTQRRFAFQSTYTQAKNLSLIMIYIYKRLHLERNWI